MGLHPLIQSPDWSMKLSWQSFCVRRLQTNSWCHDPRDNKRSSISFPQNWSQHSSITLASFSAPSHQYQYPQVEPISHLLTETDSKHYHQLSFLEAFQCSYLSLDKYCISSLLGLVFWITQRHKVIHQETLISNYRSPTTARGGTPTTV